jgi:hypothetical protein
VLVCGARLVVVNGRCGVTQCEERHVADWVSAVPSGLWSLALKDSFDGTKEG